jgi:3-isopropylmalate dehydrogenase
VGPQQDGGDALTTRIAVLPGDGIGPEVTEAALATLPSDVELTRIPAGAERYLATGVVLRDEEVQEIAACDALLLGAVGDPRVPDGVLERGILLRLRKELDLYVNIRPFDELGLVFVRENTEGPYSGVGSREPDVALETSVNTRRAVERCIRFAFELAETRGGRVTLVHKTNVLLYAGSLWREVADEVAADHPRVPLDYEHADAAAYHLVVEPSRFDVIVTDNLFGDLLSDLAAGLGGGLGRAASANLHPNPATRPARCIGLFEPIHGSAPDIAGTGTADPSAAIAAAQMMLAALDKESVSR